MNIPQALERLCYRYPSMLVDAITEYDANGRVVAVKNVTVNEDFFQGHFPGAPIMRGVNDAKFRKQVVPGDRLRLEVAIGRRRASLATAQATAFVSDQVVAEC